MSFTFVHTADWQIGRPFGNFDARKKILLREARVTAIDRIAAAAVTAKAAHVLVAGDVFDSPTVADDLLRQTLAALAKHVEIGWHLLPGNHDPLGAGGVWNRLARIGLPANVTVHAAAQPVALGPDAVLLPAPLSGAASDRDPTAWMDLAATGPGQIRVGLAHGSVRGFGSEAKAAQQISPQRAQSAGLDYLALGDWHGCARIDDRTWYPGTPEPDRYRDNDPGFVLAVHLDGPRAPPRVERVATARYSWLARTVLLDTVADWDRLADDLVPARAARDRTLLKLRLEGTATLAMRTRLEAELARVEPALFHLDAELTGVIDRLDGDDLDLVGDGLVRAIAADLQSRAGNPDDPERVVAALALRKLLRMATRIGGGETASRSSPRTPDEGSPAAVIHPFAAMATVPDEVALRPSPPSESRRRKSA